MYRNAANAINRLSHLCGQISALGVLICSGIITYDVVMRYFFKRQTSGGMEISTWLLLILTFMGAPYALQRNSHIGMNLLPSFLGTRARLLLKAITSTLSCAFCLFVLYSAWPMWWEAYSLGWKSESDWGPPLWVPYLILPVGFTVLILQFAVMIADQVREYRESARGAAPGASEDKRSA